MSFTFTSRSALNAIFLIASRADLDASSCDPAARDVDRDHQRRAQRAVRRRHDQRRSVGPGRTAAAGPINGHRRRSDRGHGLIDLSGLPYPAMPIEARVAVICAKYAMFGDPAGGDSAARFVDVPLPTRSRFPRIKGTDLQYIQ